MEGYRCRRVCWHERGTGVATDWHGSWGDSQSGEIRCWFHHKGVDENTRLVYFKSLEGQPVGVLNGVDFAKRPVEAIMEKLWEYRDNKMIQIGVATRSEWHPYRSQVL